MTRDPVTAAEEAIRRVGARVTNPRVRVLALLLGEESALTHQQIEKKLSRTHDIDRVTIYRVLEWLAQNGLAHRIAVGERAWRFDAVHPDHSHNHAHFQCGRCGTVTCLEGFTEVPKIKLPTGFRSNDIELTVKGVCSQCSPKDKSGAKADHAAHSR